MRKIILFLTFLLAFSLISSEGFSQKKDLNILIVSGGHGLVPQSFFEMFSSYKHISYELISHPLANLFFNNEFTDTYDAFVFWDIGREISEQQKQEFINMLDKGKGCVFLHHSIMSYQDWDEYAKVVGGRYLHEAISEDGKEVFPALAWELDQNLDITVVDKLHPITKGVKNFSAHDETYKNLILDKTSHVLLTTDNPKNSKTIAWTNHYGNSKTVYIQLGHGNSIFNNKEYKKLVEQSIRWVSNK
jgi:type 1 glutamine amidotransferase